MDVRAFLYMTVRIRSYCLLSLNSVASSAFFDLIAFYIFRPQDVNRCMNLATSPTAVLRNNVLRHYRAKKLSRRILAADIRSVHLTLIFQSQFHLPNTKHAMTAQFLLRRPVLRPVELLPRILCTTTSNSTLRMLSTHPPKPEEEDAIYAAEVEGVKRWWAEPRWKGITRPYSAGDVVSKRGTLKQHYPSSQTARKLFELLNERAAQGLPLHTSIPPQFPEVWHRKEG